MLKFYSDAEVRDYQFSVEKNFNRDEVKGTVVVEVSINAKDTKTERMITNKGYYATGNNDFFDAFILLDRYGNIRILGNPVGKYEPNRWYDFIVLFDMDTSYARAYVNGVLVFDGLTRVKNVTSISNIRMQQNTVVGAGPCETWFDDFNFYYGSIPLLTDYSFSTNLVSNDLVIENSLTPAIYYSSSNEMTYLDLLQKLDLNNVGFSLAIYDIYGGEKEAGAAVVIGDKIRVTSADGRMRADYRITNSPYVGALKILTDSGEPITNFKKGNINVSIDLAIFEEESKMNRALYIVQYDRSNNIVKKLAYDLQTLTVNSVKNLSARLNVTEDQGIIKIFVWNPDSLEPVTNATILR
jgi:hypothetical protein